VITDLNTLISADSGWYLLDTASINDAGQIAGTGVNPDGEVHAFMASPCPDPQGTTEAAIVSAQTNKRPMPAVPESVRWFINQQLRHAKPGAPRIDAQ
jgi:hypothetical protein